jgi:dolichyl-phosphate-mannose-protein mannosyltransferase
MEDARGVNQRVQASGRWRARTKLWIVCGALVSSVWCLTAAPRLGATFDEPTYIAAGLDRWRGGGIGGLMRLGTMPLAVDAVSLPVWIVERARGERFRIATDGLGHVTEDADIDRVLPLARAMTLVFWWLLLAAAWRLARRIGGPEAGALAVALLALEPSLVAHAALATTDIAVTAFLLAFAASAIDACEGTRGRSLPLLATGLCLGLAILSKASAIAFAPLIFAALVWTDRERGDQRSSLRDGAWIAGIALAAAFVYCGSDWRVEPTFVAWTASLPDGPAASAMRGIASHLPVFSNAGEGLVQQLKHNVRGHGAFLLGRVYPRAIWYYFPVVFAIKASGGALVALAVAAGAVVARRATANPALVAAALMLAVSPLFRVQTGIRMILPVVAFAIVGASAAIAQVARDGRPSIRRSMQIGALALVVWSALSVARAWPDAIRFANAFAGGTDHAYRLVSDSNYDWGQGLPELARRLEGRPPPLVWYWGSDPATRQGPWQALDVRSLARATADDLRRLLDERDLAVGATMLEGTVLAAGSRIAPEDREAQQTAERLRTILRGRSWAWRTRTFFVYESSRNPPRNHETTK